MCRSLVEPHATVLAVCPQPRYLALHVNCMLVLMVFAHDKHSLGPGFHHFFKFVVVVITASLLDSCLSAPKPAAADPWWYNPCTVKIRHSRSASNAEVTVKNQLKIFTVRLREHMKKINLLYNNKGNRAKTLPISKLPWLKMKRMITSITKANAKSKTDAFKQFHESLQYFAGTLEDLRHAKIEQTIDDSFNQEVRGGIFDNITNEMKSLLCEVQFAIGSDDNLKKIPLRKMNIPNSLKQMKDLSNAQTTDINFLNRTRTFFKRAQRVLFSKRKPSKKSQKTKSAVKKNKAKT